MRLVVETKTVSNMRSNSTRDIEVINKHLADAKEAAVCKSDETFDAENIKIGVDEKYHPETRKMLPKHNDLWSVRLGNLNVMQHPIDLIPEDRLFKSAPYRAGPKTLELEQFKIDKQLKVKSFEHYFSKCAWPLPSSSIPRKMDVFVSVSTIVG